MLILILILILTRNIYVCRWSRIETYLVDSFPDSNIAQHSTVRYATVFTHNTYDPYNTIRKPTNNTIHSLQYNTHHIYIYTSTHHIPSLPYVTRTTLPAHTCLLCTYLDTWRCYCVTLIALLYWLIWVLGIVIEKCGVVFAMDMLWWKYAGCLFFFRFYFLGVWIWMDVSVSRYIYILIKIYIYIYTYP